MAERSIQHARAVTPMNEGDISARHADAYTIDDYARLARECMNPALRDLVAEGERLLAANLEAFDRVGLRPGRPGRPGGLQNAGLPDTGTKILGRAWAAPLAIAPLPGQALADPEGELATAQAAAAAGLPVIVSAFAGRTFDELTSAADAQFWLEVPGLRDRSVIQALVGRAEQAGFDALVLTAGSRDGHRLDVEPVNLPEAGSALLDAAFDWSLVGWLRSVSSLPVLVAGVMTAPEALRTLKAGVDGIVVSGGDGRSALDALPGVAAVVAGRCPVLLHGGIRRGADVLASLALGADAVLLGRPVLDGLAVRGRTGVAEVLELVVDELRKMMTFTGTGSIADAGPALVRSASRPAPALSADRTVAATPQPTPQQTPQQTPQPTPPPTLQPTQPTPQPTPQQTPSELRKDTLHASVSSPVLDTMTFLNEITLRYPEAISFAPGRPYDGFFGNEQIFTYMRRYLEHLAEQGRSANDIRTVLFQYGPTSGLIQKVIADSLRDDENIDVPPGSIVVTVGAQEAMLLILRALFRDPDDVLLVSSPCYVGITGAACLLDIDVTAVQERQDGVSCADLEAAILAERARGRRPRAFYVIPDHSNPSGTTMGLASRRELLDVADRHGILILEDTPYRLVSPGPPLPTLKSLDRERLVVHLGSFSKTVFPGARVGFVIADQQVVDEGGRTNLLADELTKIKSMVTVNTPSLSQAAVAGVLLTSKGRLSEFNEPAAEYYGQAMRTTLRNLDRHLPADRRAALGVGWNKPTGGFFLRVDVPFLADSTALSRSAQEFGVIWTPMSYFHPEGGGRRSIRLSTSYLTAAEIEEGTARLARFIESQSMGSEDGS